MLNFFRISARADNLEKAFAQLKLEIDYLKGEFKHYKDDFEKLEIKALESRKIYAKKLKNLNELEEKEKAIDESSKEEEKKDIKGTYYY